MYVRVKNLNGTVKYKPKHDNSWIEGWERVSGRQSFLCSNYDCDSLKNVVGAHVQRADINDDKWYIVPLCIECNNKKSTEEIWVPLENLVPVTEINK